MNPRPIRFQSVRQRFGGASGTRKTGAGGIGRSAFFLAALCFAFAACRPKTRPQIYQVKRQLQDGRECSLQISAAPGAPVSFVTLSIAHEPLAIPKDLLAPVRNATNPEELIILDKGPSVLARFKLTDKGAPVRVGLVIKRDYLAERQISRGDNAPEIVRYQAPPAPLVVAPVPNSGQPTK